MYFELPNLPREYCQINSLFSSTELQRERRRQSRRLHHHDGNSKRHVPTLCTGEEDPEESPRKVRRKRRLHEHGIPG